MSIACAPQTWDRRFPASERREQLTRNLLAVARSGDVSAADAAALRNEAVVLNRVLALTIARRYHRRGVDDEDVDQVAMVGLCLAVDRWDPTVSTPFVAFAGPTISGEIKRHFRDRAWLVRPPRSMQNRVADVRAATEELMAELGRDATREEIAARLDVEVDLVDDARQAADAFHATPMEHDDGSPALTRPEQPTTTSSSPWLSRSTCAGRWSSCPSATGAWSSCGSSTSSPSRRWARCWASRRCRCRGCWSGSWTACATAWTRSATRHWRSTTRCPPPDG